TPYPRPPPLLVRLSLFPFYLNHLDLHSFPTRRSSDLTVSHYVKNYCHNGIQGLVSKKQSGRPSRLTDEQEAELVQIVAYHTPERSEEHTSELQSRFDLVCRLLLEKKKEE